MEVGVPSWWVGEVCAEGRRGEEGVAVMVCGLGRGHRWVCITTRINRECDVNTSLA
jgi:hypothetical protein